MTNVDFEALRLEIAELLGIPVDCVTVIGSSGNQPITVVVIIEGQEIAVELVEIINSGFCRKLTATRNDDEE